MRWRSVLDLTASVAMILVAGMLAWIYLVAPRVMQRQRAPLAIPSSPLSIDTAPLKGSARAAVALIVYSDFQCPYCGSFSRETLSAIERGYVDTGRVVVAFRNLPLEGVHPFANAAARMAICAGRQGRFWEMHDELFAHQSELNAAGLSQRARELHLDLSAVEKCVNDETTSAALRRDMEGANSLAVTTTPSFFVGALQTDGRVRVRRSLTGAQPLSVFRAVLDEILSMASPR